MNRVFYNGLLVMSVALVLTGCGSEQAAPEIAAAKEAPLAETLPPVVTDTLAPVVTEATTDTNTLEVAQDFGFDTSRTIDIDFDLESARDTQASVSICTKYLLEGDEFDVDYDSCTVQSPMDNGVFSHSMSVTNEFDSVIAVVWFKDSSIAPLHREFTIDQPVAESGGRGIRAVSDQRRVIVWK